MSLWTEAAGITQGGVLRPVNKGGRISCQSLTDKVVAHVMRAYAVPLGLEVAADDLRRTYAKLAIRGGPHSSRYSSLWVTPRC